MIYGVGTDIVRIERMKSFCESGGLDRCFSEGEKEHCIKSRSLYETAAGIFAAKEALSKAVGGTLFNVLKNSEVCWDDGKPFFKVKNGLGKGLSLHLSVSHDGEYAVAFVVAEEGENV